jgi:hypothetical protein
MTDKKKDHDEDEPKPKFRVVDRRRIDADEVEASDTPPEREKKLEPVPVKKETPKTDGAADKMPPEFDGSPKSGKEAPAEEEVGQDPLDFQNIIFSILQTLVSVTWVHLGLVPHPQSNLVAKKLDEAKRCIELFEVVFRKIDKDIPVQLRLELERVLQDMKANYVNQMQGF